MKTQFRHHLLALSLLAPAMLALPASAQTTVTRNVARAPVVNALQLNADTGLAAGSQLQFTVEGTPRGKASVVVGGSNIVVPLRETSAGVYRGTHTVRRADRIDANGLMQARITAGQYTTTTKYTYPASFIAWQNNASNPVQQAEAPRINRFEANARGPLQAGTEVRFVLRGAPGGEASVNIPGVARNVALEESERRSGVYRGSYTIRSQDNVASLNSAAATLRAANQVVTANLTEPLAASTQSMGAAPMTIAVTSPGNNASIDGGQLVLQGRTAPNATVNVKVDTIAPVVGNRLSVAQPGGTQTVQADANGNFTVNLAQRALPSPGTRHEVTLTANQNGQTAESKITLHQRS